MKLWAGRFNKEEDKRVNDFNSSISFDSRMFKQDIMGSIAHATMLAKSNIITDGESQKIVDGLSSILEDILNGNLTFDMEAEDIHMFIEAELTKRLGDVGKKLHTARSRNDQVAVDIRLYVQTQAEEISEMLKALIRTICEQADKHTKTIMPGYTHLQRAQPITFAHHILCYAQMLLRDIDRVNNVAKSAKKLMPLGSGALAGTTHPIDRNITAQILGFEKPCDNSLDGVSDRDFVVEFLSALSIIMLHLSRFSEEIILWCSWEFKFIELDDAFATGSSIMPQKKNPDIAELVRGKTGRVYGDLMTILTVMKGIPLAYNKDMQEDKECLFDGIDTVKNCLNAFTPMLATMQVNEKNMRVAAAKGFINATDCADYLAKKGIPFRDAYKITGKLVDHCINGNTILENLTLAEYKQFSEVFEEDIFAAVDLENCLNERKSIGSPTPEFSKKIIKNILINL